MLFRQISLFRQNCSYPFAFSKVWIKAKNIEILHVVAIYLANSKEPFILVINAMVAYDLPT